MRRITAITIHPPAAIAATMPLIAVAVVLIVLTTPFAAAFADFATARAAFCMVFVLFCAVFAVVSVDGKAGIRFGSLALISDFFR